MASQGNSSTPSSDFGALDIEGPQLERSSSLPEAFLPPPLLSHLAEMRISEPGASISAPIGGTCPACGMLLDTVCHLRREREMVEAESRNIHRRMISVDIYTQHAFDGFSDLVDEMIAMERNISTLRRNQQQLIEMSSDPSFSSGARMVVSRFLRNGYVTPGAVRSSGFAMFMEQE